METNAQSPEEPETKKSWRCIARAVTKVTGNITVEPILACYIIPSVLANLAIQNINLEKACRVNLNYEKEFCDNLTNHIKPENSTEEVKVQALVAYLNAWKLPLQTVVPAITILFIGAWSDKTRKRKPYLLIPMFGEFLSAVGLILCTIYFLEWPLEVAGIAEGLPPALTGGYPMMFMAVFSYIADHTTEEERTFRIGIVNIFISIAFPIGITLGGILLTKLGFYGVFSICLGIYILGFLYGSIGVKDKKLDKDEGEVVGKGRWIEIFDWRLVYDTFMLLFKRRKLNKRLRARLLMLVYILFSGPGQGTGSLIYFYSRLRYNLDEWNFSVFLAYSVIINLIGVIVGLSIFTKYLKLDDSLIGTLACISKILAYVMYGLAPSVGWLYVAPLVDIIGGTGIISIRSIATKVVESDETGKINSLFGVCDAVISAIYPWIFSAFYVKTAEKYPGAFYWFASLLMIPGLIIFIYMYKLQKQDLKIEAEHKKNEPQENLAYESEMTTL